jgi:hypothetical protein
MEQLFGLLENNAFSIWLREAPTVLAYPTVLAAHTIGMAFLVGASVAVALRMIGFAAEIPISSLAGLFRLMWLGLWINAISGAMLLVQDARHFLTLPQFYIKLAAIAVAMTLLRSLQRAVKEGSAAASPPTAVAFGLLGAWLVAITAGRVTAYAGWVGRQTATAVVIVAVVLIIAGFIVVRLWTASHPAPAKAAQRPGSRGGG